MTRKELAERRETHVPRFRRRNLGHTPIGNRPLYGWSVACSCGWSYKSNENKRNAERLHRAHLRDPRMAPWPRPEPAACPAVPWHSLCPEGVAARDEGPCPWCHGDSA